MKWLTAGVMILATVPVIRGFAPPSQGGGQSRWGYRVVNTYPHDANAFTQGLVIADGVMYESTGQLGRSSLRRVDIATGKVLQKAAVEAKHFAEGLAAWQNSLFQLTWQSGVVFVYDRASFKQTQTFPFSGEGWGLTQDGTHLILSDGSPVLRFFDPATFKQARFITVKDGAKPVPQINELEFVKGEIFANIWHSDRIARINPATGAVTGWIEMAGLLKPGEVTDGEAVLNGIAYDAKNDRLFVTGKLWPKIFEIKLERKQ
jgi:glutaminyl-peptide cyclotransferase